LKLLKLLEEDHRKLNCEVANARLNNSKKGNYIAFIPVIKFPKSGCKKVFDERILIILTCGKDFAFTNESFLFEPIIPELIPPFKS